MDMSWRLAPAPCPPLEEIMGRKDVYKDTAAIQTSMIQYPPQSHLQLKEQSLQSFACLSRLPANFHLA